MDRSDITQSVGAYINEQRDDAKILRESLGSVAALDPDYEADLQSVSARTGVPIDTVRSMPKEVKQQESVQQVDVGDLATNFPETTRFLSDPKNAAVANDDIGVIKSIENGWRAFRQGVEKGSIQAELAELNYKDMLGELTPVEQARREKLKGDMGYIDREAKADDSSINYFLGQTGYTGRQAVTSVVEGAKGAAVGATAGAGTALLLGQAGPQAVFPEEIVTVPGAAALGGRTGFIAGSVVYNYKAEAGFAWDEFKDIKDINTGAPIDPVVARRAAAAVGLLNAGLETVGELAMLKLFPGFDKLLAMGPKAAVRELLKQQTFRDKLLAGGKNLVKAATIEGITEGLQELSSIMGGEVAKLTAEGEYKPTGVGEALGRAGEATRDAFVGSIGLGSIGGASNRVVVTVKDRLESQRAEQTATFVKALGETSQNSKLLERMPEKYRELVASIKQGGPIQNVFIPSDQFVSYFQSKGVDPAEVAAQIKAKNFKEAVAAGTDIMVPVEDYAATIAKTEHHQALSQDIRFRQEDDTLREYADKLEERAEFEKNLEKMAAQEIKTDEAMRQVEEIKSGFVENLIAVGYESSAATATATSYARAIVNLANRNGIDPMVLAEKYGLTVRRPMPDIYGNNQNINMQLDPMLDALRAGKVPTKREAYGKNLIEFVKEMGGIRPDAMAGELRAIDDGKRGFARISNTKSPYGVDEMASMAVEAGYFPMKNREDTGLTEAEMIDALNMGEDIYSYQNEDPGVAELRSQLEALNTFLKNIGVDLSQVLDNEVVRQLIEQAGKQMPGELDATMFQFAGRKSLTAPSEKLREAARMQKAGVANEEIRKATGWFVGPDERWRYEISDSEAKIKSGILFGKARKYTLDEVLDHKALFEAYPQLKNVNVQLKIKRGSTNGVWIKSTNTIELMIEKEYGPDAQALVEEKEQIQNTPEYKRLADNYQKARSAERIARWQVFKQTAVGQRYVEVMAKLKESPQKAPKILPESMLDTLLHEVQHAVQSTEGFNPGASGGKSRAAYQRYLSTLGEIEARDVEARKGLTDQQRAETTPNTLTWKNPIILWDKVVKELPIEDVPVEVMPTDMRNAVQLTLFQPVYHGSPHTFEKFSLEHIGSGEGAQAYGWGLYFAENRKVAGGYFSRLSGRPGINKVKLGYLSFGESDGFNYSRKASINTMENIRASLAEDLLIEEDTLYSVGPKGFQEHVLKVLDEKITAYEAEWPEAVAPAKRLRQELAKEGAAQISFNESTGGVYAVDVPDEAVERMLLWDKPMSQQPESVRSALENRPEIKAKEVDPDGLDIGGGTIRDNRNGQYKPESPAPWVLVTGDSAFDLSQADVDAMVGDYPDPTGQNIYTSLAANLGGQKQASEFLASIGIPGLKYFDGQSRGSGDGTYNLVVWDQATIDKINEDIQRSLDQGKGDDNRGYIQFGKDRKFSITLLEKSDLSTMLHELGHFYLEVMQDLAAAPNAPDQMKADFQAILNWFGVSPEQWAGYSLEQRREYHEKFARAHEAYLMEGKAPSEDLKNAFQKFKDWLKFIYRQLTALNVELTQEVRDVFDRMYATDDEILAARKEVPITPLFATAQDAGVSEAEFEAYTKGVSDQIETAKEVLLAKLMTEKQREQQAEWKAAKEKVTEEVTARYGRSPMYQAWDALTSGQLEDGTPIKLDREALKNRYGTEFVKRIPRSIIGKQGMDPDTAAEYLGYNSGDDLVRAMIDAKDHPKDKMIKADVEQEMRGRFGDMLLDGSVQEQAKIAMHNEAREKVLLTELRAINRKIKEVKPFVDAKMADYKARAKAATETPPVEFFKNAAVQRIEATPISDIHPYAYLRAQRKAAKAAFDAMAKGNFAIAKEAKERELLNHFLYLEANKAIEEAESVREYAKRFDNRKVRERIGKAQGGYLEQIDALIDRFEFRRVSISQMRKRASLNEWINEQEAQGLEPSIDERLLDESRLINYRQATIGELRALRDSVKNIEHLARLKNNLVLKRKEIEFKSAVEELVLAADQNGNNVKIPVDPNARSFSEKFKDGLISTIDAPLMKIEQLVEWLDGGDVNGPWHQYVWNPIAEAQFEEHDIAKRVTAKVVESLERMPAEQRKSMLDVYNVPGIGQVTKKYIMSIAFNMGNQENIDKMMRGHGWSMPVIEGALRNLNAADWQFVQETWDTINSLWPEIAALEKKMTGLEPKKVEAQPYVAKDQNGMVISELRGGYFPLVYDPRHSEQGAKQESGDLSQMFEQGYVRATTPKGHTKARVEGFSAPLMLDFEYVVTGHLTKVIKDLTHREAIVAVNKVITNRQVRQALQTALGVQYEKQFMPWLRSVVNDRSSASLQGVGAFVGLPMKLRANAVAYTMGFKATTAIAQIVGLSNSMDKVKARYLARALTDFLRSPIKVTREVKELSGEMRYRAENLDRDIRGRLQQLINDDSSWAKVQRFAFHGVALADSMVSVPTWLGAYRQAIEEGKTRETAILEADAAVRLTQGAGGAKDLSAVQRGNELTKTLTMFYSYFNVLYNRMRDMGRDVQEIRDMPRFLSRAFFTIAVPAVMGELIVGRGPDDDEDPAEWAIRKTLVYPMMSVPILRDVAASVESGYDYRFTPLATGLEKIARLSKDTGRLYQDEMEWGEYAVKAGDTIAFVSGIPGGAQINATSKYLWRVRSGEEQPDSLAELIGYAAVGKRAEK